MTLELTLDQARQILQILQSQPLPLVQSLPLVQAIGRQIAAAEQAEQQPPQLREVS